MIQLKSGVKLDSKTPMLLAALAIIPLISGTAFADFEYYGAYPDENKRDALYVFTEVDMSAISSSVTDDIIAVTSAAHATSSDVLTGYLSQVMVKYDDSQSDIELHSEVYGLDSDLDPHVPYDCEIEDSGCQDLGTESTIVDMLTMVYWTGGDVQFVVGVDYTGSTPTAWFYNDEYDPGGNSEESATQFQTGTTTYDGKTYKLVQWAVESENDADNWEIELSNMKTWAPSTGYRYFANDDAVTTDHTAGDDDGSWITYRIEGNYYTHARVGEGDFCVQRNGNVDGIIELEDKSSGCLAVPTTLWD